MHLTILAIGSRGDVQPPLALGVALREAGFQVRFATHAVFEPLVRACGLEFALLRVNVQEVLSSGSSELIGKDKNPIGMFRAWQRVVAPLIEQLFEDCWRACAGTGAVISAGVADTCGPSIAQKLNVPELGTAIVPWGHTRAFPHVFLPHDPGLGGTYNLLTHHLVGQGLWQMLRPAVNRGRERVLGMRPLGPAERRLPPDRPMLLAYSPAVVPRPADWSPSTHVTGYWFLNHAPEWAPPPDLAAFLAAGPPPIYVGFGSMSSSREPLRHVVRGLTQSGRRVIVATGWGDDLAESASETVFVTDEAPHEWLFPRVAAAVHHGGSGTTAAALRAGIPSITVPFMADQPFWSRRLELLGAGASIPLKEVTAERVARTADAIVGNPRVARRAFALGACIRAERGVAGAAEIVKRHLAPLGGV